MVRVKRGVVKKAKHKKYLKMASGMFGRANRCYRIARKLVERSAAFSYIGRKQKKRNFRSKFISIINTFCKANNILYSKFINFFNKSDYSKTLDRKTFALLIQNDDDSAKKVLFNVINNVN